MTRLVAGWGHPSIGLLGLSVNNLILGLKPLREMNYVPPSFVSAARPKSPLCSLTVRVFLAANDGRGREETQKLIRGCSVTPRHLLSELLACCGAALWIYGWLRARNPYMPIKEHDGVPITGQNSFIRAGKGPSTYDVKNGLAKDIVLRTVLKS